MAIEVVAPSREEILQRLRQAMPRLREQYGVSRLAVYGSVARGEHGPSSDVDLLVALVGHVGWEIVGLHQFLERLLGTGVDPATLAAATRHGPMWESIQKDLVYA